MQGGATQAIRGYRRGAPTQQMPPAPPEPFGRIGIAGNLCVARRQRCPRIASSSRLDLARNTSARDLLYFHHGLLGVLRLKIEQHYLLPEDATRLKMSGSSNSSSLLP